MHRRAKEEARAPKSPLQTMPTMSVHSRAPSANGSTSSSSTNESLRRTRFQDVADSLQETAAAYQWRKFAPSGVCNFLQWLVVGFSSASSLTEEEVRDNFRNLVRMLTLLREYESRYGMPERGNSGEQSWVLQQLCSRLYASGTPIWVLQPVMAIAAEGLTGVQGVEFVLLPRTAWMVLPSSGASTMFSIERGFSMYMLTLLERVLVRLASFSSNTPSVNSVKERLPKLEDFRKDPHGGEHVLEETLQDRDALAKEILDLATKGYGLFFFTHTEEMIRTMQESATFGEENDESRGYPLHPFWKVDDSTRELFTRLATIEAQDHINDIERLPGVESLYPRPLVALLRAISSGGASALFFHGSWEDILVAGSLAGLTALFFETNAKMWTNSRILREVVLSFVAGLVAGLVSIRWPETTCFDAIALPSQIDNLQGFRVAFSVMEIMSRNTISGTVDFFEALLFTALIAAFIQFGLLLAESIKGVQEYSQKDYMQCTNPIDEIWYLLIVPITSTAWAALFRPRYKAIPEMAAHGVLAYAVYWVIDYYSGSVGLSNFVAAMVLTAVAGIVSRFTGRQALGNTMTGLYALVPGIYLTNGLVEFVTLTVDSSDDETNFLMGLLLRAVMIGIGAWTGTMLCAPTILGTNSGLLSSRKNQSMQHRGSAMGAMLFI